MYCIIVQISSQFLPSTSEHLISVFCEKGFEVDMSIICKFLKNLKIFRFIRYTQGIPDPQKNVLFISARLNESIDINFKVFRSVKTFLIRETDRQTSFQLYGGYYTISKFFLYKYFS